MHNKKPAHPSGWPVAAIAERRASTGTQTTSPASPSCCSFYFRRPKPTRKLCASVNISSGYAFKLCTRLSWCTTTKVEASYQSTDRVSNSRGKKSAMASGLARAHCKPICIHAAWETVCCAPMRPIPPVADGETGHSPSLCSITPSLCSITLVRTETLVATDFHVVSRTLDPIVSSGVVANFGDVAFGEGGIPWNR